MGEGDGVHPCVLEILRTEKPLRAVLDGRECLVATMFVGNCRYQPSGFVPIGGSGWTTGAWTYVYWRPGIG